MKLDERITIRLTEAEKAFFVRYANECDITTSNALRDAIACFMVAFYRIQTGYDG